MFQEATSSSFWSQSASSLNTYGQQFSSGVSLISVKPAMNVHQILLSVSFSHVKISHVRLFATPWNVVHGILQARILEWVAFPFSRGSSQPRDQTQVFSSQVDSLPAEPHGKPKNTGVGSLSFSRGSSQTRN